MSISIEVLKCSFKEFVEKLMTIKEIDDKNLLEFILKQYGWLEGDNYYILNNEFWEEYNSYYHLPHSIKQWFNISDDISPDPFDIQLQVMSKIETNHAIEEVDNAIKNYIRKK